MRSIYIVEDDPDIRFILNTCLQEAGFDVSVFRSAGEFLNCFEDNFPDLYLLDVLLPDGDGIDLCCQIKSHLRAAHIPVVIMSAHIPAERIVHSNANGFIRKPFDLDEMVETLRQLA